jgi:signal transduction histidine kinase
MSNLKTTSEDLHETAVSLDAGYSVTGWVAAIADRVKNPIAGVRAASAIIQRELIAYRNGSSLEVERTLEASQLVQRTLSQLNAYLDELSLFAKPFDLKLVPFTAHQLIHSSIEISRGQFRDKCMIGAVVQPGIVHLNGDFPRLCRAMSAIISNALESVHTDLTPRVMIQVARAGDMLVMTVDDNGSGIAPQHLSKVFEPFFSTKEAGTGLGLAIARKYIEAHGGQIKISQNHDHDGTVVCIKLPLRHDAPKHVQQSMRD